MILAVTQMMAKPKILMVVITKLKMDTASTKAFCIFHFLTAGFNI